MRNFDCITESLGLAPLLEALAIDSERWWSEVTVRQTFPGSAHHATETIFLRAPVPGSDPFNELESMDMPAADGVYSEAMHLIEGLPLRIAELGRVMVVRLRAGGRIDPHSDEGAYAANFSRFHIALQAEPGNVFRVGSERVCMRTGECWWFNHRIEHEVHNDSTSPRVHLIFDARVSSLYQKKEA